MSTYEQRQERYAAEQARSEAEWRPRLEDAFDRRNDGVAAASRFANELGIYALLFAGGSKCTVLSSLMQAERRRLRGGV